MGLFFEDPLHEVFAANIALGMVSRGGAESGEIVATCGRIADGDDDSWYTEWRATADRLADSARDSAAGGHRISARETFLRAASCYGLAFRPLFGAPVDPRLAEAFALQRSAFEDAIALLDRPGEPFGVELDGATMPGWFFPAGDERAPLLIALSGYDMGMQELFLAIAASAVRHGYHCAVFDGPGQGRMLVEQQVVMRGDWDQVVPPVLDEVLRRPDVDPGRVVLAGLSLGGYFALRAATGDPRLAACIVDPGLYGIREGMLARLRMFQVPDDVIAAFPDIPDEALAPMEKFIDADRFQHWTMKQRGYWVHGVDSIAGYIQATADFSVAGRLDRITCPTMVAAAESDVLSSSAPQVVAELTSAPVELARFTAAEGAGDHCEWLNRPRFDQRAFDWLDAQLA